jgi:AcrR family transcriptional regulator
VPPREKKRLSREDWENAAIHAIAAGGLAAVAVEPLAASLGVTKGSFYAHFRNRRELVEAALARWESSHGASLADLSAIEDPAKRLEQVLAASIAFSQSGEPSAHLRLLAEMSDPAVREAVARVDARRIARLAVAFREAGFSARRAERRAAPRLCHLRRPSGPGTGRARPAPRRRGDQGARPRAPRAAAPRRKLIEQVRRPTP